MCPELIAIFLRLGFHLQSWLQATLGNMSNLYFSFANLHFNFLGVIICLKSSSSFLLAH